MSRRSTHLQDLMQTVNPPAQHPTPVTVCIEREVDLHQKAYMDRMEPGAYAKQLKASMVAELAAHISKLKLFPVQDLLQGNDLVRIELTINDRGAYENWLPFARSEGRQEGFQQGAEQERARAPYGFEPGQFYE